MPSLYLSSVRSIQDEKEKRKRNRTTTKQTKPHTTFLQNQQGTALSSPESQIHSKQSRSSLAGFPVKRRRRMLLQEVPKGASTALGHPGVGSWAPAVPKSSSPEGAGGGGVLWGLLRKKGKGRRFRGSFVKDFHFSVSLFCSSFLFINPFLVVLLNFAFSSFSCMSLNFWG